MGKVDNATIPGAMEADGSIFDIRGSLAFALAVAFVAAFPVNWLAHLSGPHRRYGVGGEL